MAAEDAFEKNGSNSGFVLKGIWKVKSIGSTSIANFALDYITPCTTFLQTSGDISDFFSPEYVHDLFSNQNCSSKESFSMRNHFIFRITIYVPLKRFQVKLSSGEISFRQERTDYIFLKGTRRKIDLFNLGEGRKNGKKIGFDSKLEIHFRFVVKGNA